MEAFVAKFPDAIAFPDGVMPRPGPCVAFVFDHKKMSDNEAHAVCAKFGIDGKEYRDA